MGVRIVAAVFRGCFLVKGGGAHGYTARGRRSSPLLVFTLFMLVIIRYRLVCCVFAATPNKSRALRGKLEIFHRDDTRNGSRISR